MPPCNGSSWRAVTLWCNITVMFSVVCYACNYQAARGWQWKALGGPSEQAASPSRVFRGLHAEPKHITSFARSLLIFQAPSLVRTAKHKIFWSRPAGRHPVIFQLAWPHPDAAGQQQLLQHISGCSCRCCLSLCGWPMHVASTWQPQRESFEQLILAFFSFRLDLFAAQKSYHLAICLRLASAQLVIPLKGL